MRRACRGFDGTSSWDLTHAEIEGRRQAHRLATFMTRYVPGFEHARISSTAPFAGVRETRRIRGEYQLTLEDCVQGRSFPRRHRQSRLSCRYP